MTRLTIQDECLLKTLVTVCLPGAVVSMQRLEESAGLTLLRLQRVLAVLQERGLVLSDAGGVLMPTRSGRELAWSLDHWCLEA